MEMPSTIYLDYNATTPVDPRVLEAMLPLFTENFGNAASHTHFPGRVAAEAVETARGQVATLIGAEPGEIIFTSGATEALNLAIKGIADVYQKKGNHIITWQTEHKAVLDTCSRLEKKGFRVSRLPVDREGRPDLSHLENEIGESTILVAMMLANNETGVVMPVEEASKITHRHGALFLCDATQAVGKMMVQVNDAGADLLCLSAHKFYGPKGTGALFVRRKNPRVSLSPLLDGGGHEKGLRSGTLNVPGIVGLGKAAEISSEILWDEVRKLSGLRTLLEQTVTANGMAYVNGSIRDRLPNTSNIYFPGIRASEFITSLPSLAVATGSACTSARPEPSHVLLAMGLDEDQAKSSIRFSIGRFTKDAEIMEACRLITDLVTAVKLRNN